MTTPPLRVVEEGYGERDNLNASPQVPLEFNYPVRLADAANGVWFQDRISSGEVWRGNPVERLRGRDG